MTAEQLAQLLDELGKRLGPAGQHVFELTVRQVVIDSVGGIVGGTLLLVATVAVVVVGARMSRRRWNEQVALYAAGKGRWSSIQPGPDIDDILFPWVFGGIAAVIALIASFALAWSGIRDLLNPEFAALERLLHAIIK